MLYLTSIKLRVRRPTIALKNYAKHNNAFDLAYFRRSFK